MDQNREQSALKQSGGSGLADHYRNDEHVDTSSNHLQPEDYEKIAIVQNAAEGNAVVVDGGGYTAEAFEIERKNRTFKQLRMARMLRATMEKAYEDAKKAGSKAAAMKIFDNHKDTMMELVSLTDAVKGGYTLDTYNEYTKLETNRARKENRSHLTAQAILGDLRKRIAWENSTDLSTRERRQDQLILQTAIEKSALKQKKVVDKESAKEASSAGAATKKRKADAQAVNPTNQRPRPSPPVKASPSKGSPANKAPKPTSAPKPQPKASGKKTKSARKCHYCKEPSAEYLACTYWNTNGKQCKKSYCQSCIRANPEFKTKSTTDSSDWQCPSCLGTCKCIACDQTRDKERQSARAPNRRMRDFDV